MFIISKIYIQVSAVLVVDIFEFAELNSVNFILMEVAINNVMRCLDDLLFSVSTFSLYYHYFIILRMTILALRALRNYQNQSI